MRAAVVVALALTGVVVGAGVYFALRVPGKLPGVATTAPARQAASQPSTVPVAATERASTRPVVASYADFVGKVEPSLAGVAASDDPVNLESAAGFSSRAGMYIDLRGDLWVQDEDAPRVEDVLAASGKSQVHVTREEVVFAVWGRDRKGNWVAQAVTAEGRGSKKSFVWHAPGRGVKLERGDYRFEGAVLLKDGRIVVPTGAGASAIVPPALAARASEVGGPAGGGSAGNGSVAGGSSVPGGGSAAERMGPREEREPASAPTGSVPATTQEAGDVLAVQEMFQEIPTGKTAVLLTALADGVLAFRPWDNGEVGSDTVCRLTRREWTTFAPEKFPARPVHAFSLTDGSTLVLSAGEDGGVDMECLLPFERKDVDEQEVLGLVEQLNDQRAAVRVEAQGKLSRYGPSAWPVLEKVRDAQTPEAQATIDRVLGSRAKPALGIFTVLPGPVKIVTRSREGGLVLLANGGVSYLDLGREKTRSPAMLLAVPGSNVRFFHDAVVPADEMDKVEMQMKGEDVLITDHMEGPKQVGPNYTTAMLRPEHRGYLTWLGRDREGRWLFMNPSTEQKLLLDPAYVDVTPRLPIWKLDIEEGKTGWDRKDRVCLQHGDPWSLDKAEWQSIKTTGDGPIRTTESESQVKSRNRVKLGDGRTVIAGGDELRVEGVAAGKSATTGASTQSAASRPTTRELSFVVKLPELEACVGEPTLVLVPDGKLFLFNRPGRVVRFSPTKEGSFRMDTVFRTEIPEEDVRRIWVDPFGRICIAHGTGGMKVLFPEGRIPKDVGKLVSSKAMSPGR